MHRGAQPLIQQPLSRRHRARAPCAPCASCSIGSAEVMGAGPKIAAVPSPGRRSPSGTLREYRGDKRGGLMEASITLRPGYALPEEEQIAATYQHLLRRLSHQSVVKHFDAYADIDWDAEDYRIDPEDPRWELGSDDVLGATAWYCAQPQAARARLGLHLVAA